MTVALVLAWTAGSLGCLQGATGAKASEAVRVEQPGSFQGLGDLEGGEFEGRVVAMAEDGSTVIGTSSSARGAEGFLWTAAGGMEPLGPGEPHAIGADASLVGQMIGSDGVRQAGRWTRETGWVPLDVLPEHVESDALAIASAKRAVGGWSTTPAGRLAVLWIDGAPRALGDLDGGALDARALLLGTNATLVAGAASSERGTEVFLWKEDTGLVGLGDLAGGTYASTPHGMTPDGSTIVGSASSGLGLEAFLWSKVQGMRGLGDLAGGAFESHARDVSADGRIVVGSGTTERGSVAFLWDRIYGLRPVEELLARGKVPGLEGWTLLEAVAVSADGRVLAGNGIDPEGKHEGWIARLP